MGFGGRWKIGLSISKGCTFRVVRVKWLVVVVELGYGGRWMVVDSRCSG